MENNVNWKNLSLNLSLLAAALLVFTGCPPSDDDDDSGPDPDPEPMPYVTIGGTHSLALPGELTLTAGTTDGTDSGYAWTSSDDAVVTVDAGVVTAVAYGEAVITATGADTAASDTHGVVVVPELVDPDVTVVVTGAFYVMRGSTTALSAMTVNADDSSYLWEVSDDTIAMIDVDGNLMVAGVGEITVTATGADTGVSGTLGIVAAETIPNYDEWAGSGHANFGAEAFRHWDEDEPAVVPSSCAKCHSSYGFQDYIGADGTAAYELNADDYPIDSTVECTTCHNAAADDYDMVIFPSGVEVDGLGAEARCMTCHQGRNSADSVDEAIATAAVGDDEISADLGFANIHYYPAGATLNAGRVRGGYQYAGQVYDYRFRHAPEFETCVDCHDSHSLEVKVDQCVDCHEDVTDVESVKDVRMITSIATDYDGDNILDEGIYYELTDFAALLYAALQANATANADAADICYSPSAYPYFFVDTDVSGGECADSEANYGNKYGTWTPRLLRGAYNYQMYKKDPGAFAHNAKYLIELLYDSIEDLGGDVSMLTRNDPGHFNGAGEAARHWDEDEEVSASCSKCHSGSEGFLFAIEHGVGHEVIEQGNGLDCATCHTTLGEPADAADEYALVEAPTYTTPGGIEFEATVPADGLCMNCHSGRSDGVTIAAYTGTSFQNVHYLPAAGVMVGVDNNLGYHYGANDYSGAMMHPNSTTEASCTACHQPVESGHTFAIEAVWDANCDFCHGAFAGPEDIRVNHLDDYDGDGDVAEGLAHEIEGLEDALMDALQWYADDAGEADICYTDAAYPYFFTDTDGSGECETGEANYGNKYVFNDHAILYGAHHYQMAHKDPGAFAHNFDYMGQLLFDSIEDLYGGDTSLSGLVLVRPPVQ
jgi:hypothetical protein